MAMMKTFLAVLPLLACSAAAEALDAPPTRILAVFAHPDDETVVAPALANAARRGAHVRIVYASAGDASAPETGLAPGRAIAALRTEEARCASRALGAKEPIVLDFGDGRLGEITRPPAATLARLQTRMEAIMVEERPDIVITWGPDGGYGHPDHRLVSAVVTDSLARREDRPLLLHAAIRAGSLPPVPEIAAMGWATSAPTLLTVTARFDPPDLAAAGKAFACHASQFDAATRAALVPVFAGSVWRDGVPFRPALEPAVGADLLALKR
jgi:N-acetyl-1-D-myo-inositol-2-amino-2-deoxy-alpha-D-glucopyranoside deacetylase